jgi:hypothetical protein
MTMGQAVTIGLAWISGFLSAACLFYPMGAKHWRGAKIDDEVAKIARNAGARVRGDTKTKA